MVSTINESCDGLALTVRVGDHLRLDLLRRETAGLLWSVQWQGDPCLEALPPEPVQDPEPVSPTLVVGGFSRRAQTWRAVAAGQTVLTCEERRPWVDGDPERRLQVRLTVVEGGGA